MKERKEKKKKESARINQAVYCHLLNSTETNHDREKEEEENQE